MRVDADLTFSFSEPQTPGSVPRSISGTVLGTGSHIDIRCDALHTVPIRTARLLRAAAARLAAHGLTLSVHGPAGLLLTIGNVRGSIRDRLLTRSRHVRLARAVQLIRLLRPSGTAAGGLTLAELTPPSTVLPFAPTFRRQPYRVTTTHDPFGGGRPRLLFFAGPHPLPGQGPRTFYLKPSGTTVGSGPKCDLVLSGVDELQAEIQRNDDDEYVLIARSADLPCRVNGREVTTALLRTGSRIELGSWVMSYFRLEFADHGRPYGGRIGGELGFQRSQSTPKYQPPDRP